MCVRYLGFVLLAWLPVILYGQTAELPCSPPELNDGYFVPQKIEYLHENILTYSCETGFKPVVEGWWATSTCQNGKWSHTPQCIADRSCLPPTIPNGKYEKAQNGWYEDTHKITVTCEDGFQLKQPNIAKCSDGKWSSLPDCEKSIYACDEPNQIPHAVIRHEPKEVYAHNSQLHYKCEPGYSTGVTDDRNVISCRATTWTSAPPCNPAACTLHTAEGVIIINERETRVFRCNVYNTYQLRVRCVQGRIQTTECCDYRDIENGHCLFT